MNLNQVTVPCADLDASVSFYRRLGLRLIVYDPPNYARFECPLGDATFSLHRVPHVPGGHGIVVYFELEGLDAKVQQLRAAGLEFDSGPKDQPWLWREAYLRDPAGNRVCLFHAGENRLDPPWRLPKGSSAGSGLPAQRRIGPLNTAMERYTGGRPPQGSGSFGGQQLDPVSVRRLRSAYRSSMLFAGMSAQEARAFADRWLPAWTGNDPERLAGFYSDDAFYSDPAIPSGVRGRDELVAHFRTLLALNPSWIWIQRGSIPIAEGFLNFWHATIPVGDRVVEADGVCTVQLRNGLIYSNQVFFDFTELRRALGALRRGDPPHPPGRAGTERRE